MLTKLSELGQQVAFEFPTINHGGCCVYAAIVGDLLLRQGIETSVWVGQHGAYGLANVAEARTNIRNVAVVAEWNENGVWFNHVGLEVTLSGVVYHVDTDRYGFASDKFKDLNVLPGRLTVKEATWIAADEGAWNPDFPRKAIPAIRRLARQYLS